MCVCGVCVFVCDLSQFTTQFFGKLFEVVKCPKSLQLHKSKIIFLYTHYAGTWVQCWPDLEYEYEEEEEECQTCQIACG